jgi:hypothetical protein
MLLMDARWIDLVNLTRQRDLFCVFVSIEAVGILQLPCRGGVVCWGGLRNLETSNLVERGGRHGNHQWSLHGGPRADRPDLWPGPGASEAPGQALPVMVESPVPPVSLILLRVRNLTRDLRVICSESESFRPGRRGGHGPQAQACSLSPSWCQPVPAWGNVTVTVTVGHRGPAPCRDRDSRATVNS